mmetsp:Transcript_8931/g.22452  ORF Transcript_8931/g.22452 Transcript_8931/m.22452 type:complete len:265 (-) Transcript_8931:241-1035(-)|eukprot:CAMPEP_0177638018 /NCGR_PEP_ID=MMETSP0447-20121125/5270_1 /TAXON_ID=0 /ORGANISM="Stygamoeba regulata, Strain BSH-02190019" /LENGTH=264 /DNA_ID=CAMNT_0019139963 /DNA_START=47 /DNA_END=841 /DNA_ORIENTATION=-
MSRLLAVALLILLSSTLLAAGQEQQQQQQQQQQAYHAQPHKQYHPLENMVLRMEQLRHSMDQMMHEFGVLENMFGKASPHNLLSPLSVFAPRLSPFSAPRLSPFSAPGLGQLGRPFTPLGQLVAMQPQPSEQKQQTALWQPRVDVKEDEASVLISAELPGVDAEDIKVDIDGDYLTLSGARHHRHESDRWGMHVSECEYGHFERSFYLPEGMLNRDQVVASLDDGVLEITIPKLEKTLPKKSVPVVDQDRLVVEDVSEEEEEKK